MLAWYLAAALTFWSFGYTMMRGSDLWWHIAGGRWMVENRSLWVHDPYSYTAAGTYWLNDAWLSDVLLYLWVRAFGMQSLVFWKWAVIIATWLLLFRLLARLSSDRLASYIAATFGIAVAAPFLDIRPQLYGFLCWVLLLDAVLGRPQPKPWLPAILFVWVNLHASFLLGLMTLPLLFLPTILADRDRWRQGVLAAACVMVCLINPNGGEVVLRPLRYALDPSSPFRSLGEWLPPFAPGGIHSWLYPYAIGVFVLNALSLLWLDAKRRREPTTWTMIGVGTLTLAMSLRGRRFVPFFAVGQSLIVAVMLARFAKSRRTRVPDMVPAVAALALALVWIAPFPRRSYAFHYLTAEYEFPVETLNFIETNQLSGNTFAFYNWGGYVHLRTHGRMKVFIDGRSETVYADGTYRQYMVVLREQSDWIATIEKSGADFVLWPQMQSRIAKGLIDTGRWRSLYQDFISVLLVRQSVPLPSDLSLPRESAYQQLALGLDALNQRQFASAQRFFQRALELQFYLEPACENLAQAQLLAGDLQAGSETIERCRAIFPDPDRDRALEAILRQARTRRAS
jgi:hypothetical protein